MRVLIIEDNRDVVANLYAYMEPLGYGLDCGHCGDAGRAAAARGAHDAIGFDLTLPGLNGLDPYRRLRAERRHTTPVLMFTVRDMIRDRRDGFENGADDDLVKRPDRSIQRHAAGQANHHDQPRQRKANASGQQPASCAVDTPLGSPGCRASTARCHPPA